MLFSSFFYNWPLVFSNKRTGLIAWKIEILYSGPNGSLHNFAPWWWATAFWKFQPTSGLILFFISSANCGEWGGGKSQRSRTLFSPSSPEFDSHHSQDFFIFVVAEIYWQPFIVINPILYNHLVLHWHKKPLTSLIHCQNWALDPILLHNFSNQHLYRRTIEGAQVTEPENMTIELIGRKLGVRKCHE